MKEVWECGGKRCGGYYDDGYRRIIKISEVAEMEMKIIFISIVVVCVVGLVAITAAPQFHQLQFVPQQEQQHVKTDCQNKTLYS